MRGNTDRRSAVATGAIVLTLLTALWILNPGGLLPFAPSDPPTQLDGVERVVQGRGEPFAVEDPVYATGSRVEVLTEPAQVDARLRSDLAAQVRPPVIAIRSETLDGSSRCVTQHVRSVLEDRTLTVTVGRLDGRRVVCHDVPAPHVVRLLELQPGVIESLDWVDVHAVGGSWRCGGPSVNTQEDGSWYCLRSR